ncbi:MAG: stage II sporulation protein R [Clostridiales bacterium]|jgi:stage II sporulation protein R|nr:stage II sporulation protein R [Clostridiales bacterium]
MNKSKKLLPLILLSLSFLIVVPLVSCVNNKMYELIRIHIIANSNSVQDQSVKYTVRDFIVDKLTTELQSAKNRNEAYSMLEQKKTYLNTEVDKILKDKSKPYHSNIDLSYEYFPARTYEGFVVDAGYYDAVLITLGEGQGENWWCVVYPPLCFFSQGNLSNFEYKSFLLQLWNNFFGRN